MNYKTISPEEISTNVFCDIGKRAMLIGAVKPDDGSYNCMTASWGAMGVLWGKNVFWCYIRPQRYTMEFVDKTEVATLSFFETDNTQAKNALKICGTKSGRDGDKISLAGLTPVVTQDGELMFEQASMTIVGRKLYCGKIEPEAFIDKICDKACYPGGDYHYALCYEICEVRVNDKPGEFVKE